VILESLNFSVLFIRNSEYCFLSLYRAIFVKTPCPDIRSVIELYQASFVLEKLDRHSYNFYLMHLLQKVSDFIALFQAECLRAFNHKLEICLRGVFAKLFIIVWYFALKLFGNRLMKFGQEFMKGAWLLVCFDIQRSGICLVVEYRAKPKFEELPTKTDFVQGRHLDWVDWLPVRVRRLCSLKFCVPLRLAENAQGLAIVVPYEDQLFVKHLCKHWLRFCRLCAALSNSLPGLLLEVSWPQTFAILDHLRIW